VTILLDVSPVAGGHGQRGIGRYVRGLLTAIESWPPERRAAVYGVGLPGALPRELDGRAFGYARLEARPLDLGWLTARTALGSAARRARATAIHSTDPYHPWVPEGPRRIATAYDLIPLRETAMLASWRLDHRWVYRRYLRQLRESDLVIAISHATADDVAERLGVDRTRISVVYPAVAAPPPLERRPSPDDTFLYVGGLDTHKQPELALESFARYRAQTGRGSLHFVGPSGEAQREPLRRQARALGVGAVVSFRGHIPDSELDEAFATAKALLWTSRIEGFGLPPVEAIGRGVPVIAVDTPTARETLSAGARIVSAGPDEIAQAMIDPHQPSRAESRAILERFSPAATAAALAAAYELALA